MKLICKISVRADKRLPIYRYFNLPIVETEGKISIDEEVFEDIKRIIGVNYPDFSSLYLKVSKTKIEQIGKLTVETIEFIQFQNSQITLLNVSETIVAIIEDKLKNPWVFKPPEVETTPKIKEIIPLTPGQIKRIKDLEFYTTQRYDHETGERIS
jgi:hypothetical protein